MTTSRCLAPFLFAVGLGASFACGERAVPEADGAEPSLPRERVPGRVLLKLHDVDATRLAWPKRPYATARPTANDDAADSTHEDAEERTDDDGQKILGELEKRVGMRLRLLRPLHRGWGIFEVRDAASLGRRPDEAETARLMEVLRDDDAVAGVADDRWYTALRTPNDPGYGEMWHLEAIGVEAAWDVTTGVPSQRIGVVDTGTRRAHEDLVGKDVLGYDFISHPEQAGDGDGRDADYTDEGDAGDCGNGFVPDSWHGSHVAGTILASTDNGRGIAGLNWEAGLVTARALGRCGGSLSDIMDAAAWLAGANVAGVPNIGADRVSVMNLSLGAPGACSAYEQEVIDFIREQGVIFVAAAGNDGGPVGSPGNCEGVITVAAHGPGEERPLAAYSSFGGDVEIVAPGGAIQSSVEQGVLSLFGPDVDAYAWQQGTSMAAPHVAGAISLVQSVEPTLTLEDIVALLQENGVDCAGCQGRRALRIDLVLAALGATGPVAPEPPSEPPPDDALEENDSFEAASPIACDASLELFAGPGDVDWFTLEVDAGVELSVALDAGGQDLDLHVTDGPTNSDVLAASTSETGQESVRLVAPGGALALVVVPVDEATGAYSVSVTCTEPEPTEPEPTEPEPEPTTPPTEPEPEEPEPVQPEPVKPEPVQPEPVQPEPGAPAEEPSPDDTRDGGSEAGPPHVSSEGGCAQGGDSGVPVAALALMALVWRGRAARRRGSRGGSPPLAPPA